MAATVLLCDDEDVLRALIRATLNGDYEIVEARDGDEALERARAVQPDLIILDMMMPGKSGLDVVAELKRDDELRATPVLMLTARTQVADREAAAAAGVTHFLAKPFSPLELASVVEELVGDSE